MRYLGRGLTENDNMRIRFVFLLPCKKLSIVSVSKIFLCAANNPGLKYELVLSH